MSGVGSNGSAILCQTLKRLGIECVFGLPGSQDIDLYEALRRSSLRTVLATHELAAAFMANGYARASGKVAVLSTIPGPGFAYALAGLAEAFLDSAPLLHIVQKPAGSGRKFSLQSIDQKTIAGPIVKGIFEVDHISHLAATVELAYAAAVSEEPGPVLVQVAGPVFSQIASKEDLDPQAEKLPPPSQAPAAAQELVLEVARLLAAARRVVIYCGQGASGAAPQVRELAELLEAPVCATDSARGVLAEDHPLSVVFNSDGGATNALNGLMDRSDLILALGCKFSHNQSAGFQIRLEKDKLVHVDASHAVLGANYPARLQIHSGVPEFLASLMSCRNALQPKSAAWEPGELSRWRELAHEESLDAVSEPAVPGVTPPTPAGFFAALRRALPANGCLVTDSGLHQVLARLHFRVLSPRGLITPSDFQSMGFCLPAAIGAKLAAPERPVVALLGDGGLIMSGMELLTAAREEIPLTVVVFNNGALGQIRLQQVSAYGFSHATELRNPDFAVFAESMGIPYFRLEGDAESILRHALAHHGPSLVEVLVGDSPSFHARRAKGLARQTARRLLGHKLIQDFKRMMGYWRD